jgi:drug/metabolite transporter (DMT)-like permease
LIPVFNFFLGLIFLHERLSLIQIFGSLTILLGALSLTIEIEGDKFRLKRGVIMLMIVACLVNSVYDLSFKFFGLDNNFWGMIFWIYIGHIIFGLFAFIFVKTWRDEIIGLFTRNNTVMLSLNMVNEFAAIVASIIFNYALLLMPIALVSVVSNGLQPFFVLIFGIILTLIWPTLAHEKLSRRDLMPKIISIVIIFVGTFLLNK